MKVSTLNVWGAHGPAIRQRILLDALKKLDADLLCLQEVTDKTLLESLSYPYQLYTQGSELAIVSRLPVETHRLVTLSAVSALEPYRRQVLMAQFAIGETLLWVVTTHLAWKPEDEMTRLAQVKELLELVSPLGNNVLLSGDFNAEPDHLPIRQLQDADFLDLFATLHPEEPGITWDNRNPFIQSHSVHFPNRRIDYLFLRKEALSTFPLATCKVTCRVSTPEGLYPSDHYGVLATFDR